MNEKLKTLLIRSGAVITIAGTGIVGANQLQHPCDISFDFEEGGQTYEVCLTQEQLKAVQQELDSDPNWQIATGVWGN